MIPPTDKLNAKIITIIEIASFVTLKAIKSLINSALSSGNDMFNTFSKISKGRENLLNKNTTIVKIGKIDCII